MGELQILPWEHEWFKPSDVPYLDDDDAEYIEEFKVKRKPLVIRRK